MRSVHDRDGVQVWQGDCREVLPKLPAESWQTCVTSPPYWGLRNYGHDDQIGLESTPDAYVETMVGVFRAVRRLLRDDGTLWLNLGDSYAAAAKDRTEKQTAEKSTLVGSLVNQCQSLKQQSKSVGGLKPKDLVGIPWRVALALQADGWFLRSDIIWHKPSCMPSSVTDRPTTSHEYIFLLAKSQRYYYDAEAIAEPCVESNAARPRMGQGSQTQYKQKRSSWNGSSFTKGKTAVSQVNAQSETSRANNYKECETRNKRTVWTVPTKPYAKAHFAVYPPDLIKPCILAGAPEGGIVGDPFSGSGTTAEVARECGRRFVGCELNGDYVPLIKDRFQQPSLLPIE